MLYQRVLTAAVALPVTVLAILLLPTWAVAVVVSMLMLVGAWEWASLMRLDTPGRVLFVSALLLCLIALAIPYLAARIEIGLAAVFWLLVVYQLVRFPTGWPNTLGRSPIAFGVGLIVLSAPVASLVHIHGSIHGPGLVLLLCAMVWGADTGAYAAGRTLGRHKLIPNVSPGKTVEGAAGGVIAAMLIGAIGAFFLAQPVVRILALTILGAFIALISIVGDLTISMFKRSAGQKDSGFLFPGHGGVLDRLDSLTAAAPWFVIGLLVMR